jgi:hypothetical protein
VVPDGGPLHEQLGESILGGICRISEIGPAEASEQVTQEFRHFFFVEERELRTWHISMLAASWAGCFLRPGRTIEH